MAEPIIRAIREEDVRQIHEIETLCFPMPWSEEGLPKSSKDDIIAFFAASHRGVVAELSM